MELTILGSGTNVHPRRAAAGYLVRTDQVFLMDFGPRTLRNLMQTGVSRHAIRYLLFTHYHADHFSDFITFFFDAVYYSRHIGARQDLTIIGPPGTKRLFRAMLRTFPGFNHAAFRVRLREVGARPFQLGRTRIVPRTVEHSPRLHCLGYRVEYEGRVLAYSGDAVACEGLVRLCRRADVAVLDCSFPANRPGEGHMHAGDCGRIATDAEVGRLLLSHFYPVADREQVRRQAGRFYAGPILKGKDLISVSV